MAKMVDTAWTAFSKAKGLDLPRLTSSLSQKLAVSTHRESGASREEQTALAAHMAHRVETIDRYYNRANLRGERGKALDVIVGT
jgi:hypothetical protein